MNAAFQDVKAASTIKKLLGVKKRVPSAAGGAAIVKGAKKRWARLREQAKRAVS
jgi:hypothetical protein